MERGRGAGAGGPLDPSLLTLANQARAGNTEPQVPLFTDDLTGKIAVNKGLCPIGEGR